ncbi:L-fuco-beta-pyranose dehydrogenase [Geitlerinema sp. FC II]|nr:L-fuco-beta-pyranose dehydrogenase [Geitlerinema sp. FC II]
MQGDFTVNTRKLGKSDVQMTPVLLGTWQAGKAMWTGIDDEEMVRTIRAAYDASITSIDTAEQYSDGHSEQIVARALADVRDKVVYADKVFANHLKYDQVLEACERSQRRSARAHLHRSPLQKRHRASGKTV